MFCLPFAGVGPSAYRGWPEAFGPAIDVQIAQPPGREGRLREPRLTDINTIVTELSEAIQPLLDVPYAVFGHSLGGLIGFELLRALRAGGAREPAMLFVSASRPPQLAYPHPPVRHLDDVSLLQAIDSRYCGSVPPEIMESASLREFLVPPLRADLTALETYRYQAVVPFTFGISVFGGIADPTLSRAVLEEWRVHTTGACRVRMVEGGHLFLQSARPYLVAAIRDDLKQRADTAAWDGSRAQLRPSLDIARAK